MMVNRPGGRSTWLSLILALIQPACSGVTACPSRDVLPAGVRPCLGDTVLRLYKLLP